MTFGEKFSKKKIILNALKEIYDEFDMRIGLVVKSTKVSIEKDKLTGGALINQIMNKNYRFAIQNMTLNKEEMNREISFAITNARGVTLGLFTPELAFESIVIGQLSRFEEPSITCVDLVSSEVLKIVRECCSKIKKYPNLRDTLERIISDYVEERQRKTKDKIRDRIQMESSYMNTDHEDFIGLTAAMYLMESGKDKKSECIKTLEPCPSPKDDVKTTKSFQSQIVYEGWVTIKNSKCFWCVLTDSWFNWYSRNDKKDRLGGFEINMGTYMQFEINDMQITIFFSPKSTKNEKVELVFKTRDEFYTWHQVFINSHQGVGTRELISILVESYLKIIKKTMQDYIPKLLMKDLINNTRDFLATDLHVKLSSYDEEELLQVDQEAEKMCKELQEKYDHCKDALNAINKLANDSILIQ